MDEQPHHPAGEAAEVHPAHGYDRAAAGDVRGRAQVVIPERLGGAAGQLVPDPVPGVQARLHGHLGHAGQLVQAHHVPGDQDLRVAGDAEVGTDENPAGTILLCAGGLGDDRRYRRRRHPGGPQYGACLVPALRAVLGPDAQPGGVHVGHDRVHVLLDP